jgi:hypothetical protein
LSCRSKPQFELTISPYFFLLTPLLKKI